MRFVHLHNHTHYSLLDGLTNLDELIKAAKDDGAPAVAITDHGVMYGVIEFYQKCVKQGIKPIIGVEAYMAPNSRFDKVTKSDEKNYYHLILLAKNNEGYKNLLKLTSMAHLEGYYYKPRIDWEILSRHANGLIASSACVGGELPRLVLSGKWDRAKERIREFEDLFGKGNFFLELQHHPDIEVQEEVNRSLIKLARELDVPLIATNDVHYLKKEDDEAQDILLCLQNKRKKSDTDRMSMLGGNYSFRPAKEMIELFQEVPDAIENTVKIAEMCDVKLDLGNVQLPHFPVPEGYDGNSYLAKLSHDGLMRRYGKTYGEIDPVMKERLDFELSVVAKMGWPSYFLIVADFINWARNNGVVVGPGRGSAAGSLVCYLIGITNLDPLPYGLLFERFLNPDRISMPDIDTDFSDVRRDDVLKYVSDKYGHDHVAQIITFGTMAARAAIRDVGRVLDYPYDYCDKLAKMVPMMTDFKEALDTVAEFKEIYDKEEAAKKIIDYALRLEGVSRHSSIHACGVLITKDPLTEYVPVQYASSSDKTIVSQYSLHPIEDLGLLKMDFLGLRNLTIIESAIKIIKGTRGIEVDIDRIPLDDQNTYQVFQRGETTGVFQFESSGMKRYLKELKPTQFEDLIAMVALYRPGPLNSGMVQEFIDRKHGKKQISFNHPIMESALKNTYGVIVYQEQVMQLSKDMAGFTGGQADTLRKAMGKKIAALMEKMKNEFVDGCVKNRLPQSLAEETFASMEKFAEYGFNKSHAACYALVAYQTAYLKAHWPAEFMAALLTSIQDDTEDMAVKIEECRNMGIEVKQPDVNQSFGSFTVVTSGTVTGQPVPDDEQVKIIRFGLKAIKNVGEHIAEVIIQHRAESGPYLDLEDLIKRIEDRDLNKKSLESLIRSGAMDCFGERGMLHANLDNILKYNKDVHEQTSSKQSSLFGGALAGIVAPKLVLSRTSDVDRQTKLAWERELMGLYITEHPFLDYRKRMNLRLIPLPEVRYHLQDDSINVSGMVTSIKKIVTRSNDSMLFVKIEDGLGVAEILVFPKLYKETMDVWKEGIAVLVQGTASDKDSEMKVLANMGMRLDLDKLEAQVDDFKRKISENPVKKRWNGNGRNGDKGGKVEPPAAATPMPLANPPIKIIVHGALTPENMEKLRQLFIAVPGESKVYMKIGNNGDSKIIETGFRVAKSPGLYQQIREQLGETVSLVD